MIQLLDPVHCQTGPMDLLKIKPLLSYKGTYRQPGRYKSVIKDYTAYMIERNGVFLTGFLPRIRQLTDVEVDGELSFPSAHNVPTLPGITPRPDQSELIAAAVNQGRGVLLSPTGSGKTIIAMLLVSCFPHHKTLFLCHTISLLNQTAEEFKKFGFDIQVIGGGEKKFSRKTQVTISTVQTFVKIDPKKYGDVFDIIIVDEAHHLNTPSGQHAKILKNSIAPMRIGLTATLPNTTQGRLCLEGFIGPVIGEVTVQEGVEKKILAKPKIKLVPVPFSSQIGEIYKYVDIYSAGVVNNRTRNRIIIEEAVKQVENGQTVLIMVKEIAHGDNLVSMAKDLFGLDAIFVQGKTEGEIRTLVQQTLDKKIVKCVICTAVWREGINIKSLNTIILALGGKSSIQTVQALGRGLRTDVGKDSVLLIDFLDQARYLSQHAIARISIYIENGWM